MLPRNAATTMVNVHCWTHGASIRKHREALRACLKKGWARALGVVDCLEEHLRWIRVKQRAFDRVAAPGDVDLTPEGAALLRRIRRAAGLAPRRAKFARGFRRHGTGIVSIFATERPTAETEAREYVERQPPGSRVLVKGPYRIGSWWRDRWQKIPRGYRVDVTVVRRGPEPAAGRRAPSRRAARRKPR